MKKTYMLTQADDLTVTPSDVLQEETIAKMEAAVTAVPVKQKKNTRKRILACAALVSAMFMLMSAGYKVFSYLAYVPGYGIITNGLENTYTLTEAVNAGGYYVEAMSMVPVSEGEYKGMWAVTVLTNRAVYANQGEFHEPPSTLIDAEGNSVSLEFRSGGSHGSRYVGYIDHAAEGAYTLISSGNEYTVEMTALKNSVYANYQYPVSDGITMICFPMADGSDLLAFDIILEPESENIQFWAEHCQSLQVHPEAMVVTDTLGNTYRLTGSSGSSYEIPVSEMGIGINDLLEYKIEYAMRLDRRLEAPVAQIEVDTLALTFNWLENTDAYKFAIPAFGETVILEDGGVFVDTHGITAAFETISAGLDENNNTYEVAMHFDRIGFDFTENVTYAYIDLKYETADPNDEEKVKDNSGGGGWTMNEDDPLGCSDFNLHKDIAGYGDKKIRTGTLPAAFGDEIIVRPNALTLGIAGDWTIDFTTPAETAE